MMKTKKKPKKGKLERGMTPMDRRKMGKVNQKRKGVARAGS